MVVEYRPLQSAVAVTVNNKMKQNVKKEQVEYLWVITWNLCVPKVKNKGGITELIQTSPDYGPIFNFLLWGNKS